MNADWQTNALQQSHVIGRSALTVADCQPTVAGSSDLDQQAILGLIHHLDVLNEQPSKTSVCTKNI